MTKDDELLLIEKTCAVTAFDMKIQVRKDGRGRGVWFFLEDTSKARADTYKKWLEGAVEALFKMLGLAGVVDPKDQKKLSKRFHAVLAFEEIGRLLASKVREGALVEWDGIKQIHKLLGKEIMIAEMAEKSQNQKRKTGRRKQAPARYELIRQETRKPARFPPAPKK